MNHKKIIVIYLTLLSPAFSSLNLLGMEKVIEERALTEVFANPIGQMLLPYFFGYEKYHLFSFLLNLDVGIDISAQDSNGLTCLHHAIKIRDKNSVEFLVNAGANVDVRDNEGKSCLELILADKKLAKILTTNDDESDESYLSCCYRFIVPKKENLREAKLIAKEKEALEKVSILHEFKDSNLSDRNKKDLTNLLRRHGNKLLHVIAQCQSKIDLITLLVSLGANINAKDFDGGTCLDVIIEQTDETTALNIKVLDLMKYFIEKLGADVTIKGRNGRTYLHAAVVTSMIDIGTYDFFDAIDYLIKRGIDVNAKIDNDYGSFTCLHFVVQKARSRPTTQGIKLIKLLLEKKADINSRAINNCTCLHAAVMTCNPNLDLIKLLVANGANIHAICKENYTCLHLVVKESATFFTANGKKLIQYFINLGLDINAKADDDLTCLHLAMGADKPDINLGKYLVSKGANINAREKTSGLTCLHIAVMKKHDIEIIRYLVSNGGDINAESKRGSTCLSLCKDQSIRQFLINLGARETSNTCILQ